MAIANVGAGGSGVSSTSSTSFTLTTTAAYDVGDFGVLCVTTDNIATADGDTNTHTSVTGGTGTWAKIGEYTNTVGGAAGDGVCTSLWVFDPSGTNAISTVFTINLSGNATDKAAQIQKLTKASGKGIRLAAGVTNPITNGTDASNGFGSVAFSGLSSANRLWFRALGKEANSTTSITPTTSFTQGQNIRSRNNAAAVISRAEFRINTSTGLTSNPTLAVTGDTAAVYAALEEYTAPIDTGLSTETDAASALARVKSKAVALATETETASALTRVKILPIGLATETDTASALGMPARVGLANETDTASAPGRVKLRPVGLATESSAASALTRVKARTLTVATESSTASALTRSKAKATGLASESSAAYAFTRVKRYAVGAATEIDIAYALGGTAPADPVMAEWVQRHRRRGRR